MKLAMVFPGQGSQAVGMLKGYEGLPQIAETRAEASEALGADFTRLLDEGPAEKLNQTLNGDATARNALFVAPGPTVRAEPYAIRSVLVAHE
jgi:malonyl CoA-acyl carrier protein transacylase